MTIAIFMTLNEGNESFKKNRENKNSLKLQYSINQ